ncbi:MAG: hypothetical protein N4A35_12950, partial [Flavobacteriales bacterium]|nr:hypothetical protein [Flavobacteriales bacterium]
AYKAAHDVIPTETRPQAEIDKINEILKNRSGKAEYQKIIDKADELFAAKNYEKSKGLFERAKGLNPDDNYPPQKIAEIDKILADLAAANADAAAQKALRDKYDGLMSKADGLRDSEAYEEAKAAYKAAHDVIPTETRPQAEIDKINVLLKKLASNTAEEQYRKIVSKADELFEAKNYEKAKGLYERAKGLKPSDNYPPAQISKINDILASMASAEELNKKYQEFITKADDKFDAEQYKDALNNYQSALSLKPNEAYPKKRIEEIKKLLNKKEEPVATEPGEIPKYVFADYGEEVSDLDEATADNLLQNAQINKDDKRQEQMIDRKEREFATKGEDVEDQQNKTDDLNEELTGFENKISEEREALNEYSKENIPEVENYKIEKEEQAFDKQESSKEYTYDIDAANVDFKTERTLQNIASSDKSRENVPEVAAYKNERANGQFDYDLDRKEVTYGTFEAGERLQKDRTLAEIESNTKSRENVPEVAAYKNERANGQFNNDQAGKESTYGNYTEKEKLIDRFEEIYETSDVPREENSAELANYQKELNFQRFETNEGAKEETYTNADAHVEFHIVEQERSTENVERQIENAPEVDKYKEALSQINVSETQTAQDKSDDVNEAHESFAQKEDAFHESIKTVNADNTEEIMAYKESKSAIDNKESETAQNKIDDGMDDIEQIKGQKSTKFSDANQNYLASQFPEGVTEKTFQRKDANGNVVEVTTVRIVVKGNKGDEYKKVASRWSTNYFKNGVATSAQVWDTDTN